jgi:DNA-directed RNA polymerase subunit N (RpoN/RPB10)
LKIQIWKNTNMLTPIRCTSCGYPIGRVAPLFHKIRYARVLIALKDRDTVPEQAMIDALLQIDMSDVFDKLGIPADPCCCRAHLTSAMLLTTYY